MTMKLGKRVDPENVTGGTCDWYHVFLKGNYRGLMRYGAVCGYFEWLNDHFKEQNITIYEADPPDIPKEPIEFEEGEKYKFAGKSGLCSVLVWYSNGSLWDTKIIKETIRTIGDDELNILYEGLVTFDEIDDWNIEKV